jgi:uncharacterized membrane protein YgcG
VEFGADDAGGGISQSRWHARRLPWEPIALLGAVVVLWHVDVVAFEVPPFLVPGPLAVLATMQQKASLLATHGAVTLAAGFRRALAPRASSTTPRSTQSARRASHFTSGGRDSGGFFPQGVWIDAVH